MQVIRWPAPKNITILGPWDHEGHWSTPVVPQGHGGGYIYISIRKLHVLWDFFLWVRRVIHILHPCFNTSMLALHFRVFAI